MLEFWQRMSETARNWRTINCQAKCRSGLNHLSTSDSQMPETRDIRWGKKPLFSQNQVCKNTAVLPQMGGRVGYASTVTHEFHSYKMLTKFCEHTVSTLSLWALCEFLSTSGWSSQKFSESIRQISPKIPGFKVNSFRSRPSNHNGKKIFIRH